MILKLNKSTPTRMILGELGQYPIEIQAKTRTLCYWHKLCQLNNSDKLPSIMYRFLLKLLENNIYQSPFISYIKDTLKSIGLSGSWSTEGRSFTSTESFKKVVNQRLRDQYIELWFNEVDTNHAYCNYKLFKSKL